MNDPLVRFLEDMLEMARNGHLRSFACVGATMDGCGLSGHATRADREDRLLMLGEVACLQARLLDDIRAVNDGAI